MDIVRRKFIIISVAVFLLICALYFAFFTLPRVGKVPVEVLVHPEDATITINDNKSSSGVVYLKAGTHTIRAEQEGWIADEVTVDISDDIDAVALLPAPNSTEAKQLAEEDRLEREGLAGVAANVRGSNIRSDYPILNKLPHSDIAGPFKIDYGFNQDDEKTPYLLVSFTTPKSRQIAIEWLKDNKVDITTTEIIFTDFTNPIKKDNHFHE